MKTFIVDANAWVASAVTGDIPEDPRLQTTQVQNLVEQIGHPGKIRNLIRNQFAQGHKIIVPAALIRDMRNILGINKSPEEAAQKTNQFGLSPDQLNNLNQAYQFLLEIHQQDKTQPTFSKEDLKIHDTTINRLAADLRTKEKSPKTAIKAEGDVAELSEKFFRKLNTPQGQYILSLPEKNRQAADLSGSAKARKTDEICRAEEKLATLLQLRIKRAAEGLAPDEAKQVAQLRKDEPSLRKEIKRLNNQLEPQPWNDLEMCIAASKANAKMITADVDCRFLCHEMGVPVIHTVKNPEVDRIQSLSYPKFAQTLADYIRKVDLRNQGFQSAMVKANDPAQKSAADALEEKILGKGRRVERIKWASNSEEIFIQPS